VPLLCLTYSVVKIMLQVEKTGHLHRANTYSFLYYAACKTILLSEPAKELFDREYPKCPMNILFYLCSYKPTYLRSNSSKSRAKTSLSMIIYVKYPQIINLNEIVRSQRLPDRLSFDNDTILTINRPPTLSKLIQNCF
jgi:hypothetical protein